MVKIWSQSCGALGKDPQWSDYEQSLKKFAQKTVRPDTIVDFHGVGATIPGNTMSYYAHEECGRQAVAAAIRAEREGYDVFVMQGTRDAGHYSIKEMVEIPVVMAMETSLSLALMLGYKFAFLTLNSNKLLQLSEIARQYGLTERMSQGGYLDIGPAEMLGMFKSPQPFIDKITDALGGIVSRGADVIFCAPLPINMFCLEHGIREVRGALVLDNFGSVLKMAEVMVDLSKMGINRAKHGLYATAPKEALATLKRDYIGPG